MLVTGLGFWKKKKKITHGVILDPTEKKPGKTLFPHRTFHTDMPFSFQTEG